MPDPQTVLVVDDNPLVIRLLSDILVTGGYAVVRACSGAEGMRLVQQFPIDLIVLDLSMPDVDGFEVLKMLRVGNSLSPVLMISGFMDGVLLKDAEYLGATATMNKSDAPKQLLDTVRRLLNSVSGEIAQAAGKKTNTAA